jgi:C-terminal processing protease CtpA/Prc
MNMKRRLLKSSSGVAALLLAACGGGGGGGAPAPGGGAPPGGGGSSSGWVPGQFMAASNYKDMCQNPRAGIDPATGIGYPDLPGSTLDENNWLRSWSDDTYLWYDEIVDIDPGNYANPVSYFDRLKTFAESSPGVPKDKFHFTYDSAAWAALSQSGVSVGYGVTWATLAAVPPRDVAVAYSEPNTPAGDAGLAHGDRILSIDGWDVVNDNSSAGVDAINAALFPASSGEMHSFEVLDLETQNTRFVDLTSGAVTSTPVQHTGTVMSPDGATVGYLLFNDHLATAQEGLIDAVESLVAVPGGIDDLVIDIRYNGGGYLVIASQLAYMIAGPGPTLGRNFELTSFNDKHPVTNPVTLNPIVPLPFVSETVDFSGSATDPPTELPTLNLSRVFVLTGGSTCSASEAIINGLRGVGIEVVQIGETTCGKPYGFYPTDNCGTTWFTVQLRGENDAGFGDYTDGFAPSGSSSSTDTSPPGCAVPDDFDHRLGDADEARLATALHYRDNSACPVAPLSPKPSGLSKLSSGERPEPIIMKPEGLSNRILGF